jgi:hypothetical protein
MAHSQQMMHQYSPGYQPPLDLHSNERSVYQQPAYNMVL